jgi:hypothetical protein
VGTHGLGDLEKDGVGLPEPKPFGIGQEGVVTIPHLRARLVDVTRDLLPCPAAGHPSTSLP